MKSRSDTFVKVAILLIGVLFICSIDDFLSLHDIKKDYVSQEALQYLEVETSAELPDWTNTKLEWASVTVSYVIRLLAIVASLYLLVLLRQDLKKGAAHF